MSSDANAIDLLEREGTGNSAAKLAEMEAAAKDKDERKRIRKALYNLRVKGIVPEAVTRSPAEAPQSVDSTRAFSSAFDGAGNRLLLFLLPDPDGGSPVLMKITTNDIDGVVDVETVRLLRRNVDLHIERINSQVDSGVAVAEIEPDYARWLLKQAREINVARSRRTPGGLLAWMKRLGEPAQEYAAPIYSRTTAKEIAADKEIARDPADLFQHVWFEAWYFAVEDTYPWLGEWHRIFSSTDNPERDAQLRTVERAAANGMMNESMRKLYIRRLEETADVLWRRGRETEAKQALAHAIELQGDAESADVPFASEISRRTLGAAVEVIKLDQERRQRAR